MEKIPNTPTEIANELKRLVEHLQTAGRIDLLLQAIGTPLLEELRLEATKGRLRPLRITADYQFIIDGQKPIVIELQPIHKAVYLLFLAHPKGIEFKQLANYRSELLRYYMATARSLDKQIIEESVDRLVNPLDNAINEKCSRIKKTFCELMDEYCASYYIISSHTKRHFSNSSRTWFERLKVITLPREYVIYEGDLPLF
ncbi:MAG: hypothetical protein IJ710_06705 [Prevotella sp.]|nr:hypothetical protein [Prevotella sp.]